MSGSEREHHQIEVDYKCPMDGCGLVQTASWLSHEFPTALEGISYRDVLGGPFTCPDCDERGVAHSDKFVVKEVRGEPVNTDYDPLENRENKDTDANLANDSEVGGLE